MAPVNNLQNHTNTQWIERIVLGILFITLGTLIIVVFSPYRPIFKELPDTIGRFVLCVILLSMALSMRKISQLKRYYHIIFGLFILALTVSIDFWAAGILQNVLSVPTDKPSGLAFEKIKSASIAALIVLLLTKLSGESLGSIFVQKGKLSTSLIIGIVTFSIAAAGAIPMSKLLFSGKPVDLNDIIKWLPWILLFVLCNAFFEELLFRGLFLKKLEPFLENLYRTS